MFTSWLAKLDCGSVLRDLAKGFSVLIGLVATSGMLHGRTGEVVVVVKSFSAFKRIISSSWFFR